MSSKLIALLAPSGFTFAVLTILLGATVASNALTLKTPDQLPIDLESPTLVAQRSRTMRIRFAAGENSAIVENAVVRGTRDIYLLGAQKGQTMTVRIRSVENNAVFNIEAPSNQAGQRRILRQEAVSWSGKLPATGDYQIVVGTTRGNASYKLQVIIR